MSATHRIASASVINLPLRRQGNQVSLTLDIRSWWIAVAGLVSVLLLAATVIAANASTALSWSIRDSRDELQRINDSRTELVARMSALDDREVLLKLAEASGMAAAHSILYLVEDGPHTAAR
jgi:hypothetical protein